MTEPTAVYLDYQSTTPVDPRVLEAMLPYNSQEFGNPHSSDHAWGWRARKEVEGARESIAALIGADSNEIIFTSGATEANNIAVLGIGRMLPKGKKRILVSAIEHKSVLNSAFSLINVNCTVELIPVDIAGAIDLVFLRKELQNGVGLVSVMAANNEIGTIQDIELISSLVHSYGSIFHTDAAQALNYSTLHVNSMDVDLLSSSGHKIYGPKGIGFLYVKHGLTKFMQPIMFGGDQEYLRPGTLPTPLCIGLGKAASLLAQDRPVEIERIAKLRNLLFEELSREIENLQLVGPSMENRHAGNLNIALPGVEAHQLISLLQPNIAVSTGSACTSGIPGPSHVLSAIGLNKTEAESCLRLSVGRFTHADEVVSAARMISDAVKLVV